jgi:phosphohistidine phosphatase SixA
MTASLLLVVALAAGSANGRLSADSAMAALKQGGYTILWRHTATDRNSPEDPMHPSPDRFRQRNLNDKGVRDAKAIGAIFASRGIPIGEVLASPMFRTRETAEYAFGRVKSETLLRVLDSTPAQRKLITGKPAPGTNRVLVTHHFVIERHAPGIPPGDVDEGEAAIVRPEGDSLRTVAVIKMADWTRWHEAEEAKSAANGPPGLDPHAAAAGSTANRGNQKIPAALVAPENAVVGRYLHTFNTGDTGQMREFLDKFVVPNPGRTIEQRLESYQQLKGTLGTLIILSATVPEPFKVVVEMEGSTGTKASTTFIVESAEPHRIQSILFQTGQSGGH